MTNMFFYIHSGVRWLVVLATVIALLWLIYGLATNRNYDQTTRRIMSMFSSLIGLQWLLGIILFVFLADFGVGYRWEHAAIMSVALVLAHVHYMIKKRDNRQRFIFGIVSIVAVLVVVFLGVALLPQGWSMVPNPPAQAALPLILS